MVEPSTSLGGTATPTGQNGEIGKDFGKIGKGGSKNGNSMPKNGNGESVPHGPESQFRCFS